MWQSATGGNPDNLDSAPPRIRSIDRHAMEMRPLRTLLLEDDPRAKKRIISSIRMTPTEVQCVSTVAAALASLANDFFDVILIDRHLGGCVSAQTCRDLVARAGGIPVVGLINEDCVLDLQDGIEAGLTGVYYKDQMNVHLMRRLGRLAYLPGVVPSLVAASAARFGSARSPRASARSPREL
jgi:DNA-binding NarL/FixJ family response regulator